MRQVLLIFFKYPTPGRVKTRLAAAWGDEAAARFHRVLVERTVAATRSTAWQSWCCVTPAGAVARTRAWLGVGRVVPQRGRDLGRRLRSAVTVAFRAGAQRVVVIGTDSPWLRRRHFNRAFSMLRRTDVVVGPTDDGGYYLVGLSRWVPQIFSGIRWGSSQVFQQTLAQARRAGARVRLLHQGYDIDEPRDVTHWVVTSAGAGRW